MMNGNESTYEYLADGTLRIENPQAMPEEDFVYLMAMQFFGDENFALACSLASDDTLSDEELERIAREGVRGNA